MRSRCASYCAAGKHTLGQLDWGTWRSDHVHALTEHHMDFMYQKHMKKRTKKLKAARSDKRAMARRRTRMRQSE